MSAMRLLLVREMAAEAPGDRISRVEATGKCEDRGGTNIGRATRWLGAFAELSKPLQFQYHDRIPDRYSCVRRIADLRRPGEENPDTDR